MTTRTTPALTEDDIRAQCLDLASRVLRPGYHPRQIRKFITGPMCKALADASEAHGDTETAKIARRAQNGSERAAMTIARMVSEGSITMSPLPR